MNEVIQTEIDSLLAISPESKHRALLQVMNLKSFPNLSVVRGESLPAVLAIGTIAGIARQGYDFLVDQLKQLTAHNVDKALIYGFYPRLLTTDTHQIVFLDAATSQNPAPYIQSPLLGFAYCLGIDKPRLALVRPGENPDEFFFTTNQHSQTLKTTYDSAIRLLFEDNCPKLTKSALSAPLTHEAYIFQGAQAVAAAMPLAA